MAKFNLEDYEPVEDRIRAFYNDYPTGRILTKVIYQDIDRVMIKAFIYKDFDSAVWTTGIAEELRNEGGMVNKYSHVENCETSAIGRALANANYATKGKRPSREEMKKASRGGDAWRKAKPTEKQIEAVVKIAHFNHGVKEEKDLKKLKEDVAKWTAGTVSDFIGNKISLEEAMANEK